MASMDKLMRRLLVTLNNRDSATYAIILGLYEKEYRYCKISSCLSRLKAQGMVSYDRGTYTITDKGREEVTTHDES